jgi:choline monooxygenase
MKEPATMPDGRTSPSATVDRYNADPALSYTLAAPYYFDPAVYEREKEAIFYRSWNYIGHIGQFAEPGSYVTARIGDQGVFVIRGKDGRLRAFYNVCSHRAHELLQGCGAAKVITCPYHAWSYRPDGSLRTARGSENVEGFKGEEFCLKQLAVEVYAGFVFVSLDRTVPPLAGLAGDLEREIRAYVPKLDGLKFAHRLTYELKANWKNVVDNFLECYHCPPSHPAFVDLVDIKSYRTKCHALYSSHVSPPGRANNKAYSFDGGSGENNFAAWWLWPNVTFVTFPGCPNIAVLHMMPTGPETTLEHLDFFFSDSTPTDAEMAAIKYTDEVLQVEDIALVESVQRGLHSRGYYQGRYIVDAARTDISEHGVHHFHGLVLSALRAGS